MFSKTVKRCMASLLAIVLFGGTLSPSIAYAQSASTKRQTIRNENKTDIGNSIKLQKYRYPYFYKSGSKLGNNDVVSNDVYCIEISSNKFEVVGWANRKVNTIESNMKNYAGIDNSELTSFRNIDTSRQPNYSESVLSIVDDSLGAGIMDRPDLMEKLNGLGSGQGASRADLTNLNQRFAAFLYMRLNPKEFVKGSEYTWDEISSVDDSAYSDMLTQTLGLGHEVRLREQLVSIGLADKSDDITDTEVKNDGNVGNSNFSFSLPVVGILALDTDDISHNGNNSYVDSNPMIYNKDNKVFMANEMALYICLSEYVDWYITEMPTVVSSAGWETNEDVISNLTCLKIFNNAFGKYIPVIKKVYELQNPNADNLSIKDMVEKADIADKTLDDVFDVSVNAYSPHVDSSSPISQFYSSNSDVGITSYERDTILSDIEVDTTYDELNDEERENERMNTSTTGDEDMFEISNTFLTTQSTVAKRFLKILNKHKKEDAALEALSKKSSSAYKSYSEFFQNNVTDSLFDVFYKHYGELWEDSVREAIENKNWFDLWVLFGKEQKTELQHIADGDTSLIKKYLDNQTKEGKEALKELAEDAVDFGVDSDGVASSLDSVIINKFIVEGMGYSATYIPMRTNLYNADVLKQYQGDSNDESDFYSFYKKYGFMRKALLKDTSSTSAMDYYNSGGKLTNSVKVCTLRDLLYSGNKDVTLYLDSKFYNAEDAIEVGNNILEKSHESKESMAESFKEYLPVWENSTNLLSKAGDFVAGIADSVLRVVTLGSIDNDSIKFEDLSKEYRKAILNEYKFDINRFEDTDDMSDYVDNLIVANTASSLKLTLRTLKTDDNPMYDNITKAELAAIEDTEYVNLSSNNNTNYVVEKDSKNLYTDDNPDTIVLSSAQINEYLSGLTTYKDVAINDDKTEKTTNTYTSDTGYSPLTSLAYVSCIYRDTKTYLLSNAVETNNPVFMASDDLCGIKEANQWYRNTLLNYAMLKNLIANAQVDISFVTDLDCPVYMDIFGNILTESGVVVIPAACNATLHPGSFKTYNYGVGLYSIYGKEYYVPSDTKGAMSVLYPYFVTDGNSDKFIISGVTMKANNVSVRFDKLDTYDDNTRKAVRDAYKASIATGGTTRLNWMAMVKIANEVMRGAPIENIDKEQESLYVDSSKSSLIAAAKLESLLESFAGESSNTLLCIPDFSRMDNMEYWVALLIKLMAVVTTAVIIVAVYRDGVAGTLGLRTFGKSLAAIALSVSCVIVVPAVFQLTYYGANKLLLGEETLRILMVNEEKRQGGAEIGVTSMNTVDSTGEFAIQLDWISVPWYKEVENIMYESTLDNLQEVKLEAYRNSATYNNKDVTMYNDGVYVSTDDLFDSVSIDYTFNGTGAARGLYLNTQDTTQTASFYSPYYVFLRSLTADINEYNRWLNNGSDKYLNEEQAQSATSNDKSVVLGSYNYTTKYMSGERLKTVGLCEAYFTSENFMKYDNDLMHLYQVYQAPSESENRDKNIGALFIKQKEDGYNRAALFNDEEREQFKSSYWYATELTYIDKEFYDNIKPDRGETKGSAQSAYVEAKVKPFYDKVEALDNYARDFVARNKDMIGKISDETFIKTMALAMAIKYNQLFGVNSANSIEIFNMDSEDLLRLCIVPSDEAVVSTAMSYPRFVYTFGGEAGVYLAAILSVIMWVGSFIKPLCTVIVFISIFLSIFVFRVVLNKPSANIWGYCVTAMLLCVTNFIHAVILKVGVSLPGIGLSSVGCLIFIIVGQVVYLLFLSYVTGVSLKDWSNLGANEYEKEARLVKSKFSKNDVNDVLSGNIKHHDNNWDYYNDLVEQHRERNRT